jgi:hypothetical protein
VNIFSKKSALTALALLVGWIVWASINLITWLTKGAFDRVYTIQYHSLDAISGVLVSVVLFALLHPVRRRAPPWRFLLLATAACGLAGVGRSVALQGMLQLVGARDGFILDWRGLLIGGVLAGGGTLGLFLSLAFAVDQGGELAVQRETAARATALAQQAQLQMLRYQLNPHFLFNALNSIRAMILEDASQAREMVTELAEFLRYSLDGKEQESTIDDELQAIDNYLAIQRIRFDERLDLSMVVDPAARGAIVPCFLIHPLVENAVKHGMRTSAMPLRLEIEVRRRSDAVSVRVSNTGRLADVLPRPDTPRDGTGTGGKNIAQRLKLAFPGRHSFGIEERDGWVHARLRLEPDGTAKDDDAHGPDRR